MSRKQTNAARQKALSVMNAFQLFCEKHVHAVPAWIAADYLAMTPQGIYAASERGWIAYFQHGRNRLYSYRDVMNYRWQSRKFGDNFAKPIYEAGHAKFDVEIEPLPPPTKEELEALELQRQKAIHEQALDAYKGKAPWPWKRWRFRDQGGIH